MEDFKLILDYVFSILSIPLPIFGFEFSLLEISLSLIIFSIVVGFIVQIFGGEK